MGLKDYKVNRLVGDEVKWLCDGFSELWAYYRSGDFEKLDLQKVHLAIVGKELLLDLWSEEGE